MPILAKREHVILMLVIYFNQLIDDNKLEQELQEKFLTFWV